MKTITISIREWYSLQSIFKKFPFSAVVSNGHVVISAKEENLLAIGF